MVDQAPLSQLQPVSMQKPVKHQSIVGADEPRILVDYLALKLGESKAMLKRALTQGCCQIKRKNYKGLKRVRRSKFDLFAGDRVEFNYDPNLVPADTSGCRVLYEESSFGLWFKPAGVLSQGTKWGDEGSIIRHIEKEKPHVHLIHRLDFETSGVMVFSYTDKAAEKLSRLWQGKSVEKIYLAEVLGDIEGDEGQIELDIDGKYCRTHWRVLERLGEITRVEARLATGRKHQIRIHFEAFGHPVIGDPKYGKGNKNREGLRLQAYRLSYDCPMSKKRINVCVPDELKLF
ncbi:MAG: RNA pseudouridine synthase [Halobacteriovorax sp.]|nr:RNA pseudouridine synthase [Halobacteriovorax sp.]